MFVGEDTRNPNSMKHVLFLEESLNEKKVRIMNLGIVSLIWLDNYSQNLCQYMAKCEYLKPQWVNFHERIVDVGFMNKWWLLEDKMKNYDVNDHELDNVGQL